MSAAPTVWIVGGIAWDTVLHIATFPPRGGYVRGSRRIERQGGSAANVALALASSGVRCGFTTTVGDDDRGRVLEDALAASALADVRVTRVEGETEHVLVVVDSHGDRTLFGLAHPGPAGRALAGIELAAHDVVVFVVWEEHYLDDLLAARAAGCTVVVGLHALLDPRVPGADIAIGSKSDLPAGMPVDEHLGRFGRVILTSGVDGAWQLSDGGQQHQPAHPVAVLDSTGAGDAFLAGYLTAFARGDVTGSVGLAVGARWAAAAVASESSVPPPWDAVPELDLLLRNAGTERAREP